MPTTQADIDQRIADFIASPTDSINLSGLGIQDIPQSLIDFVQGERFHIEDIDLSNNGMDKLPSNLEALVYDSISCVTLNFSHNNIADFTAILEADFNLFEINVSHNPIGDGVGELFEGEFDETLFGEVGYVSMSNCQLSQLPDKLDVEYEEFTKLDLSNNALTELPSIGLDDIMGGELNIANNQLTTMPEWLPEKEGLETLDIRGNPLTVDLSLFVGHEKLNVMNIEAQQIAGDIPKGLYIEDAQLWLPNASMSDTTLSITDAGLSCIPAFVFDMTELTRLNLSSNPDITEIPPNITKLTKLRELYLSKTNISELPACLAELTVLSRIGARYTNITTVPDALLQSPNFRSLEVEHSQLTELPLHATHDDFNLEVTGCNITSLPDNFAATNQYTHLDLSENNLHSLPTDLGPNLISLNVTNNQIGTLPASTSVWKLEELYLGRNQLTAVPASIFTIKNLELDHNPFDGVPQHVSKRGGKQLIAALRDGQLPKTGAEIYAELFEQGKTGKYDGLVPDTEACEPGSIDVSGEFTAHSYYTDAELPEGYALLYTYDTGNGTIFYAVDTRTIQYTVYVNWGTRDDWTFFCDNISDFLQGFAEYVEYE